MSEYQNTNSVFLQMMLAVFTSAPECGDVSTAWVLCVTHKSQPGHDLIGELSNCAFHEGLVSEQGTVRRFSFGRRASG